MEILLFLISFFIKEYGGEEFLPILQAFKDNSFDLKKTLKSINPELIALLLGLIMKKTQKNSSRSQINENESYKLMPIKDFANPTIFNRLDSYLSC